jgi:hypothetical protein
MLCLQYSSALPNTQQHILKNICWINEFKFPPNSYSFMQTLPHYDSLNVSNNFS